MSEGRVMAGRQGWAAIFRAGLLAALVATAVSGCAKAAPPQQAPSVAFSQTSTASASPEDSSAQVTSSPATSSSTTATSSSESATPPASSQPSSAAGTPDGPTTGPGGSASVPQGAASVPAPSASMAPGVKNLQLSPDLAREIVIAGATHYELPVTAYEGLAPGMTFVGRDSTGTIWAGASLLPSPSSVPAQVTVQDDGSYLLLRRGRSGEWTVWSVGTASAGLCAKLGLPGALRTLWGWPATGCRPAGGTS